MSKRILALMVITVLAFSLVSCKKTEKTNATKNSSAISSSMISSSIESQSAVSSEVSSSSISSSIVSSSKASSKSSSKTSSKVSSTTTPTKTALQYFNDADKKMDALKSFAYVETETAKTTFGEFTMETKTVDTVKADTVNNQKRFTVNRTITVSGQSYSLGAYYDGKYYVQDENGNYEETSFEEYLAQFPDIWQQDKSKDIPDILQADLVSSTKSTYSGGIKVTLVVKGSKFNSFLAGSMSEGGMDGTVNLDNVTIEAKINNDGYFEEINFSMKGKINATVEGQAMSMSLNYVTKQVISNPGKPVTVTLPR